MFLNLSAAGDHAPDQFTFVRFGILIGNHIAGYVTLTVYACITDFCQGSLTSLILILLANYLMHFKLTYSLVRLMHECTNNAILTYWFEKYEHLFHLPVSVS